MEPLKHESKEFDILINYSKEAQEKELFKFKAKSKDKMFEVSADQLLEMVARYSKQKDVAVALMDTVQHTIPAVQAHIPVHFKAAKDYKSGEIIQFTMPMVLPYFLATVMDAYKLAILDKTAPIVELPQSKYEEAAKKFEEINKNFVETFWKKENELMKAAADTAKAEQK